MSKNKKIKIFFGIIAALLIIVGVSSFVTKISGATFGGDSVTQCKDKNSVCAGRYTNAQCRAQGEEVVFNSGEIKDQNYHFFKCGFGEIGGNDIFAYVKTCKFEVDIIKENVLTTDSIKAYMCSNDFSVGDPAKSSKCSQLSKLGLSRETGYKQITTGASNDNSVGTLVIKGVSGTFGQDTTYSVRMLAQPYFLVRTGGDNFVSQDETGCLLKPLLSKEEIIETQQNINVYNGDRFLAFDSVANWLWGYQEYTGVNLIKNYNNKGKDIYINKPNYYMEVETTKDGVRYARVENQVFSSEIECVPDEPSCDDKTAKRIIAKDLKCSDFEGLDGDYIAKNNGKSCKYVCKSNKPVQDCVKTTQCDSNSGERIDFASNKCVVVSKSSSKVIAPIDDNKSLWIAIAIIGVGILIAVVIMITGKRRK